MKRKNILILFYTYYYIFIDWLSLSYYCFIFLLHFFKISYSTFWTYTFFLLLGIWIGSKISLFLLHYKDEDNYNPSLNRSPTKNKLQKNIISFLLRLIYIIGFVNMLGLFFFKTILPSFMKNGNLLGIVLFLIISLNLIYQRYEKK